MNRIVKILIMLCMVAFTQASAQTTNYHVHSLFVINIAKYSTWPGLHAKEFNITILGKSKIYDELVKNAAGKNINNASIQVKQVDDLSGIEASQVIYLADGKSSALNELLKATEGKSIMIIAEREGLYKKGAGFSFVILDNNTLRYDINHSELEKRQIRISKNLSMLANQVL